VSDKLNQAIKYIKSGDKDYGKHLLVEVLNADPTNDKAWLWMSAVVDTDEMRRECLEKVLEHNPRNQAAKKRIGAVAAQGSSRNPGKTRAARKD
jgi:hypothetical protein